ncbi:MAG: hypothetical protein AAFX93_02440 [Verrucomicrobiota bacterium]
MKATLHVTIVAALPFLVACQAKPNAESVSAAPESTIKQVNDFWFSGAELCRYDLKQSRYGQIHPGHAEFIFVTEPFDLQGQVKSDRGGAGSVPILKLNALRTFNTGLYSYRTMLSTFTPIEPLDAPHALKETFSVQDWCGQVFTQINRHGSDWRIQSFSYFQSEGDGDSKLPNEDAWLEEELFTAVRLNPASLPMGKFQMMPSQMFFRFIHQDPTVFAAEGSLTKQGEQLTYTVTYPDLSRKLTITFDEAFPYIIRSWSEGNERSGLSTTATLTHREMNVNYWELNRPKQASLRKDLGLDPVPN